jgi:hypothetical protein
VRMPNAGLKLRRAISFSSTARKTAEDERLAGSRPLHAFVGLRVYSAQPLPLTDHQAPSNPLHARGRFVR